jgi:Predicted hydrolase of the alpha/beta superfamily
MGFLMVIGCSIGSVAKGAAHISEHSNKKAETQHSVDWKRSDGEVYRVFVNIPNETPPEKGFPIVFVLDGNATFNAAAEFVRLNSHSPVMPRKPAIVIGIGYPLQNESAENTFDLKRRWFDLTPPTSEPPILSFKRMQQDTLYRYGGAQRLLTWIDADVMPWLVERYPIDKEKTVLFGHSLGGLTALFSLTLELQSFRNIIAASPSLWWNEGYLKKRLDTRFNASKLNANVLILVGSEEKRFMIEDSKAVFQQLKRKGVNAKYHIISPFNHGGVMMPALSMGLQWWQPR